MPDKPAKSLNAVAGSEPTVARLAVAGLFEAGFPNPTPAADPGGMSLDQLSRAFATLLGETDDSPAPLVVAGDPILASETDKPKQSPTVDAATVTPAESFEDTFPVNPRTILEAMLFVGRADNAPLASEQMAGLMRGVAAAEIDGHITELNAQYAAHGCPYTIISDGPGYRLVLRPEFNSLRERMLGRARAARLSPAAVEILALIAYNEPLTSSEVSQQRGTPSGHILRQLVRRRLLRLEKAGAKSCPAKYFTTPRFLEVFHLNSLADLPH
ncbi:MAG: SMC-Scp complex subunit ScpB, partial [Terriglobia bacterium]